jgi:hypothetical protein
MSFPKLIAHDKCGLNLRAHTKDRQHAIGQTNPLSQLDMVVVTAASRNMSSHGRSSVAEVVVAGSSCVKQYVPFHSSLLLDSLHMQVVEPVLGDTLCKQHSNILRLVTVQASFYINFMMKHNTIFKQVSFSSASIRLSCRWYCFRSAIYFSNCVGTCHGDLHTVCNIETLVPCTIQLNLHGK